MTLDDLRHHHRLGRPVVCLVRIDGGGHWVVVRGVTRSRVHFHDPADGRQSLPFAEWESRWIDTDRAGTVFRQHGISVLN
jgi:ABC-type bacteriocin/lantibiotic exporter with double-glycine peptidase domain